MKKDLKKFAHGVFKWLSDKPHSKYQAFAYALDRLIVAVLGGWLAVTAFVTSQIGFLLLLLSLTAVVFFGLYLVSKGR